MKEILKYSNCFICGDNNIHGLKARFFYDGEKAFTEIETGETYEGYRGIFHGGIISSLLDEVMIKALLAVNIYAVTAEMTVKYIAPAGIGTKIKFTGKIIKQKGRLSFTEGTAISEDGKILATATGKYIEAGNELKQQLMKSIS